MSQSNSYFSDSHSFLEEPVYVENKGNHSYEGSSKSSKFRCLVPDDFSGTSEDEHPYPDIDVKKIKEQEKTVIKSEKEESPRMVITPLPVPPLLSRKKERVLHYKNSEVFPLSSWQKSNEGYLNSLQNKKKKPPITVILPNKDDLFTKKSIRKRSLKRKTRQGFLAIHPENKPGESDKSNSGVRMKKHTDKEEGNNQGEMVDKNRKKGCFSKPWYLPVAKKSLLVLVVLLYLTFLYRRY